MVIIVIEVQHLPHPKRGQTLTGLELQEYKISMNDGKFNDATCEKTSRIAKARKWSEIDWKTAYNYVNRLQIRIVKATEKKNWNPIKRLQHLGRKRLRYVLYEVAISLVGKNAGFRKIHE